MNASRAWLALVIAFPVVAAAAPAPPPKSQGPIADALRLVGLLPRTEPLLPSSAVMVKDGVIELRRPALIPIKTTQIVTEYVEEVRVETVTVRRADGTLVPVKQHVKVMVPVARQVEVLAFQRSSNSETVQVPAKSCKFFTVTKDGKLEAIDVPKAAAMLKTKVAVLTGLSAETDPRALELVKPGTLCVIQSPFEAPAPPDRRP